MTLCASGCNSLAHSGTSLESADLLYLFWALLHTHAS